MKRIVVAAAFVITLSACAYGPKSPAAVVSVQYDDDRYDPGQLQATAETQCRAMGYPVATPVEDQGTGGSVRWSYRTFNCYEG